MYSQNQEEKIIKDYFGPHETEENYLTLLSIGENDGKTLSNTLACIERGWYATLVEPSEKAFAKMFELHKDNPKVEMFKFAISNENGIVEFFESGEHAKNIYGENHSLLSSLKESETKRWTDESFVKTKVEAITIEELLKRSCNNSFDLISIDAEGLDYDILTQIDLFEIGCNMLIVENNGAEEKKYINYCGKFGMRLHEKTHENLIFVR